MIFGYCMAWMWTFGFMEGSNLQFRQQNWMLTFLNVFIAFFWPLIILSRVLFKLKVLK